MKIHSLSKPGCFEINEVAITYALVYVNFNTGSIFFS